jgi:adenylosuccinate lyase
MRAALDRTHGLIYSSAVLVELLGDGAERERAYRSAQAAADRTAATGTPFTDTLAEEGVEPREELRPERFLVHHDVIRRRLEMLDELED